MKRPRGIAQRELAQAFFGEGEIAVQLVRRANHYDIIIFEVGFEISWICVRELNGRKIPRREQTDQRADECTCQRGSDHRKN